MQCWFTVPASPLPDASLAACPSLDDRWSQLRIDLPFSGDRYCTLSSHTPGAAKRIPDRNTEQHTPLYIARRTPEVSEVSAAAFGPRPCNTPWWTCPYNGSTKGLPVNHENRLPIAGAHAAYASRAANSSVLPLKTRQRADGGALGFQTVSTAPSVVHPAVSLLLRQPATPGVYGGHDHGRR